MPHVMADVHKYPDVRARSEKKSFYRWKEIFKRSSRNKDNIRKHRIG